MHWQNLHFSVMSPFLMKLKSRFTRSHVSKRSVNAPLQVWNCFTSIMSCFLSPLLLPMYLLQKKRATKLKESQRERVLRCEHPTNWIDLFNSAREKNRRTVYTVYCINTAKYRQGRGMLSHFIFYRIHFEKYLYNKNQWGHQRSSSVFRRRK